MRTIPEPNSMDPEFGNFLCATSGDTVLMQSIDFIAEDACGNRDTSTAVFAIVDNLAPNIIACQQDTTIFTDQGACSATFTLMPPTFEEECSVDLFNENITSEVTLTSNATPDEKGDVPVDPAILQFDLNTSLPVNAFSAANLTISLIGADAEGETEFLFIKGEDGTILGQTNPTDISCGDSETIVTITKEQFNNWAADGRILITIEPNVPVGQAGRFSVNDICENGTIVRGNLQATVKGLENVQFKYRMDGGDLIDANFTTPVSAQFDEGPHTVVYYLEDCAGNVDSCVFILTVKDNEAPALVCPDDITAVLELDTCTATIELPFIAQITDNCKVGQSFSSTLPIDTADALIRFPVRS